MEEYIKRLRETKAMAALGGGKDKIAKEHEKGKLTAWKKGTRLHCGKDRRINKKPKCVLASSQELSGNS